MIFFFPVQNCHIEIRITVTCNLIHKVWGPLFQAAVESSCQILQTVINSSLLSSEIIQVRFDPRVFYKITSDLFPGTTFLHCLWNSNLIWFLRFYKLPLMLQFNLDWDQVLNLDYGLFLTQFLLIMYLTLQDRWNRASLNDSRMLHFMTLWFRVMMSNAAAALRFNLIMGLKSHDTEKEQFTQR